MRMDLAIHQPAGRLAAFVKCMWIMEQPLAPGQTASERIPPTGCISLLFDFGDRPEGHVAGQRTSYTDWRATTAVRLAAVVLRPEAGAAVLGLPAGELRGRDIDVQHVLGPAGPRVALRMAEAPDHAARLHLLERLLLAHLAMVAPSVDPRLRAFVREVTARGGRISVRQLASHVDLSRRQLERKVGAAVGLTPKEFCRVVRYQKVLALKQHDPSLTLTQLAYAGGYADQAHFTREFSRMTGYAPSRAFARCPAFSDYYTYA